MRAPKALMATVLGVAVLLAVAAPATAGAAAYRHYVGCGVTQHASPAHACSRSSKKGAFFESLNANVVYAVCVRFPTGKNLCKRGQEATEGTLYVNPITSNNLGKHMVTWFVSNKRVGSYSFTVRK
jgi:hypothetical protein